MKTTLIVGMAALWFVGAAAAQAQDLTKSRVGSIRIRYIEKDVPTAMAFYANRLGFKIDVTAGPYFAALSRDGVQLLLSPTQGSGGASQPMPDGERPAPGGWARIVVTVSDIQADVSQLRQDGVHFRNDITTGPGGREILLDDPSGNPVELFQPG